MDRENLAKMMSQLKVVCATVSVKTYGTGYMMVIKSTGVKGPRWAYFNENYIRVDSKRKLI